MYRTSKEKRSFLEGCGFTLSNEPEVNTCSIVGTTHSMEVWTLDGINHVRLYIHFDNTDEANYCNLYEGDNERDVQYFSERNLISQMKKRGFHPSTKLDRPALEDAKRSE